MKKIVKNLVWCLVICLVGLTIWNHSGESTPEEKQIAEQRLVLDNLTKQIEIERKKPKITALTLEPGKTITVDVRGKKWVVDSYTDGEFTYSLVYQNQTVKTGRFKNYNGQKTWDRIDPDTFPVDSVILEKDSGGPLTIMLTLTEKE